MPDGAAAFAESKSTDRNDGVYGFRFNSTAGSGF